MFFSFKISFSVPRKEDEVQRKSYIHLRENLVYSERESGDFLCSTQIVSLKKKVLSYQTTRQSEKANLW